MAESNAAASPSMERQRSIYAKGVIGWTPSQPVAFEALRDEAKTQLKAEAYDYLTGGAGAEDTIRANYEGFQRWRIVPRVLHDAAKREMAVELFGRSYPTPVLLAPIGVQGIFHKHAELAVARAARSLHVPFILSTVASKSMEEVAEEMGDAPRWFQLYWPNHPELAGSFLRRAENAGFGAIVVTLDTQLLSWRERDLQNAYAPFILGEGLANYTTDPVFQAGADASSRIPLIKTVQYFVEVFHHPSLTWNDLPFLRQHTRLPILLKGILHPDDARKAVEAGMDGLIVSNHGGRQVDGAVGALDMLPGIGDAVGGRIPVLFDSGIRRGADVFKALALGAKAVLLGRPYCYGLAVNGEQGVRDVLLNLLADFDLTMGLAGCSSVKEIDRRCLVESR